MQQGHASMREKKRYLNIPKNYTMLHMYEVITIIKILMQVLQPQIHKGKNATMNYYFPYPGINETMYF